MNKLDNQHKEGFDNTSKLAKEQKEDLELNALAEGIDELLEIIEKKQEEEGE